MKKKSLLYWLKELVLLLILGSAVAWAVDWYRSQDMPAGEAPPLVATTVDGQQVNLAQLSRDKPVVLYFWTTWCPACKFVSPGLSWLSDDYTVVAVSGSSGPDKRVNAYMQAHDYQFLNINDERGEIFRDWNISVTPAIFIIKDGQIRTVTTGITTPPGVMARVWLNQ